MNDEKGFTLVEVIASIVIIGIVLISVSQLMIQSNNAASINNEKLVAIDLADAVLQRLKAESYVVENAVGTSIPLELLTMDEITIKIVNGETVFIFGEQQYLVEAIITDCPESAEKVGLKNVKVTVNRVQITSEGIPKRLPGKSEIEGYVEL